MSPILIILILLLLFGGGGGYYAYGPTGGLTNGDVAQRISRHCMFPSSLGVITANRFMTGSQEDNNLIFPTKGWNLSMRLRHLCIERYCQNS
jgi:hypothetical protein